MALRIIHKKLSKQIPAASANFQCAIGIYISYNEEARHSPWGLMAIFQASICPLSPSGLPVETIGPGLLYSLRDSENEAINAIYF